MKIGATLSARSATTRKYFCDEYVSVRIKKDDEYSMRRGIFEGFYVKEGTIYLVLKQSDITKLVPVSMITANSIIQLGGVPQSAIDEAKTQNESFLKAQDPAPNVAARIAAYKKDF